MLKINVYADPFPATGNTELDGLSQIEASLGNLPQAARCERLWKQKQATNAMQKEITKLIIIMMSSEWTKLIKKTGFAEEGIDGIAYQQFILRINF